MTISRKMLAATVVATTAFALPANAADGIRLATEAQADGYVYEWLPNGSGATLIRPGVRVVVTIGQRSYDVNDSTPIADEAPRFDGRDIVISPRLARHLHEIAVAFASRDGAGVGTPAAPQHPVPYRGTMTLSCRQLPGSNSLEITGSGPASSSVTVTLRAAISRDLPFVTVSRIVVPTQPDGSYHTQLNYDQVAHENTVLTVAATAAPDVAPATARFTVGVPTAAMPAPALDAWPK